MNHYLLIYDYVADILDRRPPHRAAHLAHARAAVERGELILGGAFDPPDKGVLLFAGEDASAAERFAQADPYLAAGLIERWAVHRWTTVVGPLAAHPV